jgi:hypothetical protein
MGVLPVARFYNGAGSRIRTDDLLITNQLLYQLSYAGVYLGKPSREAIPKIEQVYSTISTVC